MFLQKKMVVALLAGGMAGVSGQTFAHWSSGPFLYNDAGTNPLHLLPGELPSTVLSHEKPTAAVPNPPMVSGTSTATGTTYGTYTQTRAVTSDYGWIQGTDDTLWANSHDNKGLAFSLAQTSKVTFTVTTLGTAASATQAGATSATTLTGQDWTPAFSIFQGLAPQSAHEGGAGNTTLSNNLPGYAAWGPYASAQPYTAATDATYEATTGNTYTGKGTWGAFRSQDDWVSGRDVDPNARYKNGDNIGTSLNMGEGNVSTLDYKYSAQAANGAHTVTWSGTLDAGDYSIWVGGTNSAHAMQQRLNYMAAYTASLFGDADALAAANAAVLALRGNYGFSITTTVQAVPVPGAVWLFGSAMAGLMGLNRRKVTI